MGRRVLVTGGAGFIGSHIVDRLIQLGAEVTVLDNLMNDTLDNIRHNLDKIKFIQKDIRDDAALDEALKGVEFILHQAALRSVPKSVERPYEYNEVNVNGTLKLFLKAKEKGIRRIVYASSSSVYGERDTFPERETDLPCPISPYAATKLISEHYAYLFSKLYGLEIVSLRYFNVYGPRQSLEDEYAVVVPKFITCLLKGQSPPIYGDGNQERDFTYIANVVDVNIAALNTEGIAGEVFNIALGKPHSVNELFKILKGLIKSNLKPTYCPPRKGDVRKTHAEIKKAREMLAWQPRVDFEEGLKKTVEWFSKQMSDVRNQRSDFRPPTSDF